MGQSAEQHTYTHLRQTIFSQDVIHRRYSIILWSLRTKEPLDEVKEESEKVGLKLNIHKTKIMASSPITSWQIDRKQWKQ